GYVGHFPGLLDFTLNYQELQKLINHENTNDVWKRNLSITNGIYLILDQKTGQQYIGAAYGHDGIWQRWQNYAQNGHGGNKILKKLSLKDKDYTKHFLFSVLQTLPSNSTSEEVIKIENLYKEKLGSRAHGLNDN